MGVSVAVEYILHVHR
jgi:hypothetical protein